VWQTRTQQLGRYRAVTCKSEEARKHLAYGELSTMVV
jgi:hypothetical protein